MTILQNIFSLTLAGHLVQKWSVALNKFNNNLTKYYYISIEKKLS